jgi:hypothetical protein
VKKNSVQVDSNLIAKKNVNDHHIISVQEYINDNNISKLTLRKDQNSSLKNYNNFV